MDGRDMKEDMAELKMAAEPSAETRVHAACCRLQRKNSWGGQLPSTSTDCSGVWYFAQRHFSSATNVAQQVSPVTDRDSHPIHRLALNIRTRCWTQVLKHHKHIQELEHQSESF